MRINLTSKSKNKQSLLGSKSNYFEVQQNQKLAQLETKTIAVSKEIDRDNYFYTVRTGSKVLGIFTRELNSDTFIAKAYYHNPDNLKTQQKSFDEAVAAIVAAYTGTISSIPKLQQTTYHLTLESIEVDEFGIPDEQRVVVRKNEAVNINWHLWAFNYSELIGEGYRLINVVEVDRDTSIEF